MLYQIVQVFILSGTKKNQLNSLTVEDAEKRLPKISPLEHSEAERKGPRAPEAKFGKCFIYTILLFVLAGIFEIGGWILLLVMVA